MNSRTQKSDDSGRPSHPDELQQVNDSIRLVARRTFTALKPVVRQAQGNLVRDVARYLLRNYADKIILDEIALEACLSKFHLVRRFRQLTGITPCAFLKRVRMVKAMDLLVGSRLEVKHIAHKVGYADVSSFCRAFRTTVGSVPTIYRLTHQAPPQETQTWSITRKAKSGHPRRKGGRRPVSGINHAATSKAVRFLVSSAGAKFFDHPTLLMKTV
jgi:AraC-like DNA-binding protein